MIMFQYILFDLDGTLTDPKEGITKSVQFALDRCGIREPDIDKLEPFIGPPLKSSFMEFYGMSEDMAMEAVAHYRERFQAMGLYENIIYPGIPEMLQKLKQSGKTLAVASSKPEVFVSKILKYFKIEQYFDVVTGSGLDGSLSEKEEVVEETLARLTAFAKKEKGKKGGMLPSGKENCAMVGDRKFDVYGGRQFQLTTIGVSYGYAAKGELEKAGADYIVSSVAELSRLLLGDVGTAEKEACKKSILKKDGETTFQKTWNILFPFLLYYIANSFCYMLFATLIQVATQSSLEMESWLYANSVFVVNAARGCSMLGGMAAVMPFFLQERKNGRQGYGRHGLTGQRFSRQVSFLVHGGILAVCTALWLNAAFFLSGLTGMSARFNGVLENQYQIPVWQGLVLYGVVAPLVEEVVFRGIIYNRLKRYFSWKGAILLSAVFFGGYHGNMVQGLYGFLLGCLIAWAYERTGNFRMPVFFHACANVGVFLTTYGGGFSVGNAWMLLISCAIFSVISFFRFQKLTFSQ